MILYCDQLEQGEELLQSKILSLFPLDRQIRLDRMKKKEGRIQSAAAYLLYLLGLDRIFSVGMYGLEECFDDPLSYHNFKINCLAGRWDYNRFGKPELQKHILHFNLTHTEGLAACAFSAYPIGLDAQKLYKPTEGMARLVFNQEELQQWMSSAGSEDFFTKVWTEKESILKRYGTGIQDHNLKTARQELSKVLFLNSQKIGSCYLTVCGSDFKQTFEKVEMSELLQFAEKIQKMEKIG